MPPKLNTFFLTTGAQRELEQFASTTGWFRLSGDQQLSWLPPKLAARTIETLVISAPTSTGGKVLVLNSRRADAGAREIDQQPLVVPVHSTGCSTVATFIDHGDWDHRSEPLDLSACDEVTSSGIAGHYRAQPTDGTTAGTFADLGYTDRLAFARATGLLGIRGVGGTSSW